MDIFDIGFVCTAGFLASPVFIFFLAKAFGSLPKSRGKFWGYMTYTELLFLLLNAFTSRLI